MRANANTRLHTPSPNREAALLVSQMLPDSQIPNAAVNQLSEQLDQSKIIDEIYDSDLLTKPDHLLFSIRNRVDHMKLMTQFEL